MDNKMNIREMIKRHFGLVEKFAEVMLLDGSATLTYDGEELIEGLEVYVITPDGNLPAPDGTHALVGGMVITTEGGKIVSITTQDMPVAMPVEEQAFAEATLIDGTKIMTDVEGDFAAGQKLYVITEAGEKVSAPEGEHTTESGIVLTVDAEGTITGVKYPDQPGEASLQEIEVELMPKEEIVAAVAEAVASIMEEVEMRYKEKMEELEKKFNDFSKAPATEKTTGISTTTSAKEFSSNRNAKDIERLIAMKKKK
jgi:hypothetical protein